MMRIKQLAYLWRDDRTINQLSPVTKLLFQMCTILNIAIYYYHTKPSAQLPKHIKNLQDDNNIFVKNAVMKPETSHNLELE